MLRISLVSICLGVTVGLSMVTANASLVTVEATGSISSVTNNFGRLPSASINDTLMVSYTFDTTAPSYGATGQIDYIQPLTSFSYRINTGSVYSYAAFSGTVDPVTQVGVQNIISLRNQWSGGSVVYNVRADDLDSTSSSGIGFNLSTYYLSLSGSDPGILADTSIDSVPNIDALFAAPDPFNSTFAQMIIEARNGGSTDRFTVGRLTNLSIVSITPVPTPAAVWLLGSGIAAMFGFARGGKRRNRT